MASGWLEDGPLLPIEFARRSKDGRLTLVCLPDGPPIQTLWCLLDKPNMETAREALRLREGIPGNGLAGIGSEPRPPDRVYSHAKTISAWARQKSLDGVVWTALGANFGEQRSSVPDLALVIEHLEGLSAEQLLAAEEYVRRAPISVQTPLRDSIEGLFGWKPLTAV